MAYTGPLISSSGGIRIANRILPAEPTLSDMDSTDIGFKLLIENYQFNFRLQKNAKKKIG